MTNVDRTVAAVVDLGVDHLCARDEHQECGEHEHPDDHALRPSVHAGHPFIDRATASSRFPDPSGAARAKSGLLVVERVT